MPNPQEDEQSPIASQLFTMGRLIRDICGRDLGNKLLDAIEPIEEEMHIAIRQYVVRERLDELERKMTLHIEALSSADYKAGFQDALDQIDKANRGRVKQLKKGQDR